MELGTKAGAGHAWRIGADQYFGGEFEQLDHQHFPNVYADRSQFRDDRRCAKWLLLRGQYIKLIRTGLHSGQLGLECGIRGVASILHLCMRYLVRVYVPEKGLVKNKAVSIKLERRNYNAENFIDW